MLYFKEKLLQCAKKSPQHVNANQKYATLLLINSTYLSFEVYFNVQLLNSP